MDPFSTVLLAREYIITVTGPHTHSRLSLTGLLSIKYLALQGVDLRGGLEQLLLLGVDPFPVLHDLSCVQGSAALRLGSSCFAFGV